MAEKTQKRIMSFDDGKKELTLRTEITEIYNKKEMYNVYINLSNQLRSLEQTMEQMKKDMKEIEPHFLKIKDEVEKETAK